MAMSIEGTEPARLDPGDVPDAHRHIIEQDLLAEFSGLLARSEIERLTSESLARFENAPVRAFVPILATRTARRLARAHLAEGSGGSS